VIGDRQLLSTAFGSTPGAQPGLGPGTDAERPAGDRWLAAVVLGARGRYAAAYALLSGVLADPGAPATVRAHAAVTRAAHLRQLGGHTEARRWDAMGLALATDPAGVSEARSFDRSAQRDGKPGGVWDRDLGRDAARLDALIGLAADAIGIGDLPIADRLLNRVEREILRHSSWRSSVRLSWVRAELALSQQCPAEAAEWAARAVRGAGAAGAVRHEIKSELVLIVAESAAGVAADDAVSRLNLLTEKVRHAQLRPLEWVICLLLANLTESAAPVRAAEHRRRCQKILTRIRLWTDPDGRSVFDRSPWVPDLCSGPLLHSENL
jgi:hypothetical protein